MIDGGFKIIRVKDTPFHYSSFLPGAIYIETDPRAAAIFSGHNADDLVRSLDRLELWVAEKLEVIPAPMCSCCGNSARVTVKHWRRDTHLTPVPGGWRCEKHVGRSPCMIEGCGKTFPHKPGEDYSHEYLCGFHWRQGPKDLRDRCREIERIAKRKGWNNARVEMHHRAWSEIRDIVQSGGRMDEDEINRMFGWDS